MRLNSISPPSGYPSLNLYWYVYLTCAVRDGIHLFDHRLLQPSLYAGRLLCAALDDHLVAADEDQHSPPTFASSLP
jgi:hypothetical protein